MAQKSIVQQFFKVDKIDLVSASAKNEDAVYSLGLAKLNYLPQIQITQPE